MNRIDACRPAAVLVAMTLAWSGAATPVRAQSEEADREAVLSVLDRLFDGMRMSDSAMVGSVFHPSAQLIGTAQRDGSPVVSFIPIQRFVTAVGNATGEWNEPYWDPIVQIRDNLATVWTDYAFYLDGEFSHCGVDAFMLARTEAGWKIVSLADTRQADGCELPPQRD